MIQLPSPDSVSKFSFDIDLEDKTYRFYFAWNDRASSWFFTLTDVEDNQIISSKRVALATDLLLPATSLTPPGVLLAFDNSDKFESPGYDELGKRVSLVYIDSTEL